MFYHAVTMNASDGMPVAIFAGHFGNGSFTWTRRTNATPLTTKGEFQQDHLQLRCDPSGSPLYLAYIIPIGNDGTVNVVRSLDGGLTWEQPQNVGSNRCNYSRAAIGPDREFY